VTDDRRATPLPAGSDVDRVDTTILGTPRDGQLRPLFGAAAALFIAFPILNLFSADREPLEIVLVLVATTTFAGLMIWTTPFLGSRTATATTAPRFQGGVSSARHVAAATLAVLVLLAVALTLSLAYPDTGWFALFYYASTGAATIRSTRVAISLMIVAGVLASLTFLRAEADIGGAIVQGLSVSIIGLVVYSAIAVRRTNRALVAARHELARLAVTDERSRIARDLHDTLGHSLSVIALKSELAERLVDEDPARARTELEDVQRVARESLAAVRETIGGYRQPTLAAELAGARSTLAAAGISGRVEPAPENLPPAVDAVLAWAVREGVTNIIRHGHAGAAEILVESAPTAAAVEIRNDRVGETPLPAPEPGPSGSGLAGLRERTARLGGGVEAGLLPDGGFRLRVSVPIA
jgi:two-component system sensor histidine kinase DesK